MSATLDSVFSRPNVGEKNNHSGFRVSIFDSNGYAFAYSVLDPESDVAELCPVFQEAPSEGCEGMPTVFDFDHQQLTDTGSISTTLSHLLMPGKNSMSAHSWTPVSAAGGRSIPATR